MNFEKCIFRLKVIFVNIILFTAIMQNIYADDYLSVQDSTYSSSEINSKLPIVNFFSTSFTKYVYTYLFNNLSNFNIKTEVGNVLILQDYQGSFLNIANSPKRDDEHWSITYSKPLKSDFGIVFRQNLHFTSDSRDIGLNQLMRLNGAVGLQYEKDDNHILQVLYGIENNNLLNMKSKGSLISIISQANGISFENILLNMKLNGNFVKLKDGRENSDIDAALILNRNIKDESELKLFVIYRNLQSNLIGYSNKLNNIPIEVRDENTFSSSLFINYLAAKPLNFTFDIRVQNLDVGREFKQNYAELPYSFFSRNINQLDILGNTGVDLQLENFSQKLIFGFNSRSERNNLLERYPGSEISKYQMLESQRDNISGRYNIFTSTKYNLSANSQILGTYFIQLFRYDTPSEMNFDDRDELSNLLNLKFYHKFSDYLNLLVEFENRQNHLVYIFSERSALNNTNKVYRFSPQIYYKIGDFSLNPKLEVLANYTVYDYAKTNSSMNSISFRQIAYSDSLFYKISEKFSIHSIWKIKYSERGVLYWDDFSETPQSGNSEIFAKFILRRDFMENIWIGSGFNFFKYSQIRLNNNSQIDYNLESISPEITINYVYDKWTLSILGWYEFQTIKSSIKNQITNLSINVNLLF